MDTKSKSIRHSLGAKLAASTIVCLCFVSALVIGFFLVYKNEAVNTESYFETNQFKQEYARYIHNTVELQVKLKSEADIRASGRSGDAIEYDLQRLYQIQNRLSKTVNFAYYIYNTQTREVFTNLTAGDPLRTISQQPTNLHFNRWGSIQSIPWGDDVTKMLAGTPYEISVAVLEPLKEGDAFYDQYQEYSWVKSLTDRAFIALAGSLVLMLAAFIYLAFVSGRREKDGEIVLAPIDSIYTDLFTLLVVAAGAASFLVEGIILDAVSGLPQILIASSILWGIDAIIGLTYILSLVRQAKKRQVIKNSLIYKLLHGLHQWMVLAFTGRIFKAWTLLLLLAYGIVNAGLIIMANDGAEELAGLLLVVLNLVVIYLVARALQSLSQIMAAVKEIAAGNLDYPLDATRISAAFSGMAGDILNIQEGLRKAVAEAIKGERMKTDLITNVSHDLKTPLTSIVNYVDLLKQEDLDSEKATEYVAVLDEKSSRLKQLIDDLFEASKVTSGNITVAREKVDLHALVMQACGEFEEKLNQAELSTVVNAVEPATLIAADGKCMWRVVENLLSNALKYSMPRSRVYIDITQDEQYGSLVIKNISAHPLDITPDQLIERFVRGETSRSTEGSGLGLSIARSLTAIQGGRFKIEIDGDLFKVTVDIPLWKDE
ncbi:MAG: sensor histidine kinase [Firmicutes bacterium]|nr:sensor histidine kinase [Bacillota bacterium]